MKTPEPQLLEAALQQVKLIFKSYKQNPSLNSIFGSI
jgi:hypothetical protein